jgi:hypothetical protein
MPDIAAAAEPERHRRSRRRQRRRRPSLGLLGLVGLGLAATAGVLMAGALFLRSPTTHTIPFLSDDRVSGPVVEHRNTHPVPPGRAGGPPTAAARSSRSPSGTPSARASAAPSTSANGRQPEAARSGQPGHHWLCTLSQRGFVCVPAASAGSPSPSPSWSWTDPRYQ